jgi:hypothetical protein
VAINTRPRRPGCRALQARLLAVSPRQSGYPLGRPLGGFAWESGAPADGAALSTRREACLPVNKRSGDHRLKIRPAPD